ncbi:hypothetical protein C8F04DRAFT_950626 [Mycena alexandri]|uniref:Transmembrane protein n=1 Tax=Mycena alexandri TaxID=1745969 RepID=A0AAD6T5L1_9AGAR|nr:hypothetical protein C8F04DRAFT_950626 [Mycena alexandri]
MAALYLHNSIWVPDAAETPHGLSPHNRTTSSTTLQTLPISEHSHPTQPLLHSSTSESVAYLDLLSRQPTHPNAPRGSAMGLSFDGDPTTVRERKGYVEKVVRRRLRRLKIMMAVLEVVMALWSLYTTVRYFLAYAIYPSSTDGQIAAIVLATVSIASFAVLLGSAVIPFLQMYLLARHISIEALLAVRTVLRYLASVLIVGPAVVNFALVFAWRRSSDSALNMANRCDVDIDVVWSIRSHPTCASPSWGAWLALAIVRLLVTVALLAIYHLSLASYSHTRRPSHYAPSSRSESTYLGSPPMSVSPLPPTPGHLHQPSTSTVGSGSTSRPTPDRRSLRSSRGSSMNRSPSAADNLRLPRDSPRSSNEGLQDEFDPYANLPPIPRQTAATSVPTESDRELYSFVDRFRSLVSQINREAEDGANIASPTESTYLTDPTFRSVVGYDEFGRPYPPDDHVRILNSYIRRMPTIESIGSREMTASTSVAASSLYQEQMRDRAGSLHTSASLHTLSRPPTRSAMHDRDGHSEPPSRAGSLGLVATELINAMGAAEGLPDLGELVDRVRRSGSIASSLGSSVTGNGGGSEGRATSYFGVPQTASPMQTPIAEEPHEGLPSPSVSLPPPSPSASFLPSPSGSLASPSSSLPQPPRAVRPLPRRPIMTRADSV